MIIRTTLKGASQGFELRPSNKSQAHAPTNQPTRLQGDNATTIVTLKQNNLYPPPSLHTIMIPLVTSDIVTSYKVQPWKGEVACDQRGSSYGDVVHIYLSIYLPTCLGRTQLPLPSEEVKMWDLPSQGLWFPTLPICLNSKHDNIVIWSKIHVYLLCWGALPTPSVTSTCDVFVVSDHLLCTHSKC